MDGVTVACRADIVGSSTTRSLSGARPTLTGANPRGTDRPADGPPTTARANVAATDTWLPARMDNVTPARSGGAPTTHPGSTSPTPRNSRAPGGSPAAVRTGSITAAHGTGPGTRSATLTLLVPAAAGISTVNGRTNPVTRAWCR